MRACYHPVLMAAALIVAGVAGCATPPPASDPAAVADFQEANDPLEPTNRVIYAVNDGVDLVVLRPLALAYRAIVPQTVRDHTHNVLGNLGSPVALANDMMEGKPRRAGDTMMRFLVNTTVGVAGVFDVATGWGWPAHEADAGMTLGIWGVPEGPFLFLPVLGPSNPRDAVGFGVDYALDPLTWIGQGTAVADLGYARLGVSALDARERVLDALDRLKREALDPYATIRSLARQHRQSEIDDARADNRATVPDWYTQPPAR
jgi:phospholipid-binding lipoprotein MlaA